MKFTNSASVLFVVLAADSATAFVSPFVARRAATTNEFASFAASLEEDESPRVKQAKSSKKAESVNSSSRKSINITKKTWQAVLDELLDLTTPASQRQVLLSDLMNANEDIRADVEKALKSRNVSTVRIVQCGKRRRNSSRIEFSNVLK
jgi:hypothetical protein